MTDEIPEGYEFEITMPFVTTKSHGGPHDDDSYVAGWEMGKLWSLLEGDSPRGVAETIHAENLRQADLIAMHFGYTLGHDEPRDGWVNIELTRNPR